MIADIAGFLRMRGADASGVNIEAYSNVKRWFDAINARPAVQRGVQVLKEVHSPRTRRRTTKRPGTSCSARRSSSAVESYFDA